MCNMLMCVKLNFSLDAVFPLVIIVLGSGGIPRLNCARTGWPGTLNQQIIPQ